jgi:hypothetical protein
MFNQLRMNLRRNITFPPAIFDDAQELLSSSYFISDEDGPWDFDLTLATTRDPYHSIRVEIQTVSEMCIQKTFWASCISAIPALTSAHDSEKRTDYSLI